MVLSMHDISKTFPGVKALQHVDFTLRKGEIHALMGENGAGKSTLIKVLTGVHSFESGEILMAGSDGAIINRSPQEAQEHGISTVYQEVNLCPNLTVAENLFIGREPRKCGMIDWRTMNRKSAEVLKSLDINVSPTQNLDECSIAIQQMIAIARAVDMKCKVLILDEPMAGLDPSGREEMLTLLSKLYEERQISIVLVSHNMDDVAKYADRILVMNEGELVLDGVPKKVFHYQDELEQIGLGVPQMTHLIHRLEKATGCRLGDAITLEEGLPLIEQWWHAKGTSR